MKEGKREGAGRKKLPVSECTRQWTFRINLSLLNQIEGNKSEFIKQAIQEKLDRLQEID